MSKACTGGEGGRMLGGVNRVEGEVWSVGNGVWDTGSSEWTVCAGEVSRVVGLWEDRGEAAKGQKTGSESLGVWCW